MCLIVALEFDTEQSAVIMPRHHSDFNFPQKAVMLFMEPEIDEFAACNKCEVIGKFVSVTKKHGQHTAFTVDFLANVEAYDIKKLGK